MLGHPTGWDFLWSLSSGWPPAARQDATDGSAMKATSSHDQGWAPHQENTEGHSASSSGLISTGERGALPGAGASCLLIADAGL